MSNLRRYTVFISQSFAGRKGVLKNIAENQLQNVMVRAQMNGLFPTYEEEKPLPGTAVGPATAEIVIGG